MSLPNKEVRFHRFVEESLHYCKTNNFFQSDLQESRNAFHEQKIIYGKFGEAVYIGEIQNKNNSNKNNSLVTHSTEDDDIHYNIVQEIEAHDRASIVGQLTNINEAPIIIDKRGVIKYISPQQTLDTNKSLDIGTITADSSLINNLTLSYGINFEDILDNKKISLLFNKIIDKASYVWKRINKRVIINSQEIDIDQYYTNGDIIEKILSNKQGSSQEFSNSSIFNSNIQKFKATLKSINQGPIQKKFSQHTIPQSIIDKVEFIRSQASSNAFGGGNTYKGGSNMPVNSDKELDRINDIIRGRNIEEYKSYKEEYIEIYKQLRLLTPSTRGTHIRLKPPHPTIDDEYLTTEYLKTQRDHYLAIKTHIEADIFKEFLKDEFIREIDFANIETSGSLFTVANRVEICKFKEDMSTTIGNVNFNRLLEKKTLNFLFGNTGKHLCKKHGTTKFAGQDYLRDLCRMIHFYKTFKKLINDIMYVFSKELDSRVAKEGVANQIAKEKTKQMERRDIMRDVLQNSRHFLETLSEEDLGSIYKNNNITDGQLTKLGYTRETIDEFETKMRSVKIRVYSDFLKHACKEIEKEIINSPKRTHKYQYSNIQKYQNLGLGYYMGIQNDENMILETLLQSSVKDSDGYPRNTFEPWSKFIQATKMWYYIYIIDTTLKERIVRYRKEDPIMTMCQHVQRILTTINCIGDVNQTIHLRELSRQQQALGQTDPSYINCKNCREFGIDNLIGAGGLAGAPAGNPTSFKGCEQTLHDITLNAMGRGYGNQELHSEFKGGEKEQEFEESDELSDSELEELSDSELDELSDSELEELSDSELEELSDSELEELS